MESPEQYKSRIQHLESDLHNLEAYMEEFTSFLPLAVCIVNKDRVIVDLNQAFTRFVGYDAGEASGSKLSVLFKNEEQIESLLDAVANTPGAVQSTKVVMVSKSGSERTVRVTAGVRHDVDSNFTGFFIGIGNVFSYNNEKESPETASKDTEPTEGIEPLSAEDSPEQPETADPEQQNAEPPQAPQATSYTYADYEVGQKLIDSVDDGLVLLDGGGEVSVINSRAADALSVRQRDVLGKKPEDVADGDFLQTLCKEAPVAEGKSVDLKLGDNVFSVTAKQISAGGDDNCLIKMHDISKDEYIEDMKLTFVSVAAHQIRTPLSSIRWSFELLVNQLDNGENRDIARRGYRSTKNMLEIVNELLNLDRLNSGEDGYNFDAINVVDMIDNYVEEVQHNNEIIEQAAVRFDKPLDALPKVRADTEKLRIVLRNLVDNALKYTPTDGTVNIETSVHVSQDYGNDMVQFSIKDSGIGIPEDQQEKIFSKFYRAENATKQQTDGTGVGLFISKQIVDKHNGKIWFDSTEGEGSTFYVQLPMAQNQE